MPIRRETDSRGVPHARNSRDQLSQYVPDPELIGKQRRALELYVQGTTYSEIAEIMQIPGKDPRNTASRWVRSALKRWPGAQEDADMLRERENGKLDKAEAKVWEVLNDPPFSYGSSGKVVIHPVTGEPQRDGSAVLRAVGQLVNLSRRRAALNGLDVPVKHEVKVSGDIDVQIESYISTLAASGDYGAIGRALAETVAQARTVPRLPAVPGEVVPGPETP